MDRLPIEIVIKILRYLNSYELIQFCETFESYKYLLRDKEVVRFVNFSRNFEITKIKLQTYIMTSLNYSYIQVLNINYVYWIPLRYLTKLIDGLQNLKVLYAIDTKLGISSRDIAHFTNLKKLAISAVSANFDHSSVIASRNLKSLTSFCLKISKRMERYDGLYHETLYDLIRELQPLEELWISDEVDGTRYINYSQIAMSLKNLKKFVIKSKNILPSSEFSNTGHMKIFECKRFRSGTELILERISTKMREEVPFICGPAESNYKRSWETCCYFCNGTPYGPKESQMFHLTKSLKAVYFYDLNFCNGTTVLCCPIFTSAALNILSSKNSLLLNRLSFRCCFFKINKEETEEKPVSGFKRSREGVIITSTINSFQNIANNLKNLRELEILSCPRCTGETVMAAYPLIQMFQYLKKLVLEIPSGLDGSFLKQVLTNCQYLETLYLFCKDQNDGFIKNLCHYLKYQQNLKHFRLDSKEVPLTLLLHSFNKIKHKKLLRIFVKCDTVQAADNQEDSMSLFLKTNPQLIFCFFVISGNTNEQNIDLEKMMNQYRSGYRIKFFFIKKDMSHYNISPIPATHYDIVFYRTNVAAIDIDEF